MNTVILTSGDNDIARASDILSEGGLVAFPTETVYGLGADAFNEQAVLKIFKAKGRPADNPLIVHIADMEQLKDLAVDIPDIAYELAKEFWPGALTMVLKKSQKINAVVSAGLDTVAVRMPSNAIALKLLKKSGLPLAAPSANRSGKPSPTLFRDVFEDMEGRIDAVIDGGECAVGVESTVVDLTADIPVLLRPGGVTAEQIETVTGHIQLGFEYTDGITPKSPGMKYRHYAPKAEMFIVRGDFRTYINANHAKYKKIGVLVRESYGYPSNAIVKEMGSPENFASKLFSYLRELDREGVEVIFSQDIDDKGINMAVKNRLYKAAGNKIIGSYYD